MGWLAGCSGRDHVSLLRELDGRPVGHGSGMADCPSCGAPVVIADLAPRPESPSANTTVLVLDRHEVARGPGRYAIWDDGTCRPVAAAAEVLAHPVHQCSPPMPR